MHILEFKHCPNCKGELERHEEYLRCLSCGEKIYINPTPGVSVLPVKDGKVLLSRRAIEPWKGEIDTVGGFMKPNESAEEAGLRETKEETGLIVGDLIYLGTYPSEYGHPVGEPVINIYYIAEVKSGKEVADDDVSELLWFPIEKTGKIKSSFANVLNSLRDLRRWFKNL
ncbi:NUDIX domain-containing protein [Candidatus Woesebacteria bacterium]|nr:NUDIX domain-containing protein [Candidatus Woesebacteria bacterium]